MPTRRARTDTLSEMSAGPFEFVFQENRSFMFEQAPMCPACTRVGDARAFDDEFELRQPNFDISITYDGCVIVSDAFVGACVAIPGPTFIPIASAPGFSVLEVDRVTRIEPFDSHVRSGPACDVCGEPRYVTRTGPLRLYEGDDLESGFTRTDVTFGDTADFGPHQPKLIRPLILVDEESARTLKSSRLRGIHFVAHP